MTEQRASTADLLRYVADSADWLAHRPDALEAFEELEVIVGLIKHTIDTRNPGSYAGPCDVCGLDMYAKPGATIVTCRMCDLEYDLEPRRQKLLKKARQQIARPAEISRALTSIGTPVTPERIRQWVHRGDLKPAQLDREKHRLYRIRDVLDLLDRPVKKKGA